MMRNTLAILALTTALAACGPNSATDPLRGVDAANVPVVSKTNYAFDASAPDGTLSRAEQARLDGWFQSLQLGYGDSIYVDGPYASGARGQVAQVAGRYGMMVGYGSPVTEGSIAPGTVRVVVSRARASVPNCPNWSVPSQPNLDNKSMSNMGCGVNANLAAMIANPEDLIHGREGGSVVDASTAAKAVDSYRKAEPTGTKGLTNLKTSDK